MDLRGHKMSRLFRRNLIEFKYWINIENKLHEWQRKIYMRTIQLRIHWIRIIYLRSAQEIAMVLVTSDGAVTFWIPEVVGMLFAL